MYNTNTNFKIVKPNMSHNHPTSANSKNLTWTIIANLILTIIEFIVGSLSGSLSLISDATHNSVDIITLIIAYIAEKLSKNKADYTHSYGFKRIGILASLLNSMILAGMAVYIFISAFHSFQNPQPVQANWVILVSIFAIAVNAFSAFIISRGKKDLNMKTAYTNMFFDALASVGTLISGLIILLTKWYWIDALVSTMIGVLLIRVCVEILKEALDILLEAVPKDINLEEVKARMLSHECVHKVADLHIWSMTSEDMVLTSVIEINPECLIHLDDDIDELKSDLKAKYNIYHQTIEARIQAQTHED
jgi:cobalt-zinc-cadmium efflux system protein